MSDPPRPEQSIARLPARRPPSSPDAGDPRRPLGLRSGAFAMLLAMLWGGQPVAIKAGLGDSGPLQLSAMRMALGGIVVIGYAIVTRTSLRPSRRELRPLAGLGVLFVVQTTLMYVGGDHTTAGHASVLIFTFPLWTSIFGHFFVPGDRMSRGRTGGLLIAYGGVVVVFAGGLGGDASLGGDLMMISSAMLLGGRQIYLSHFSQGIAAPRLLMTQSVASVFAFGLGAVFLESGGATWSWEFVAALLYQGRRDRRFRIHRQHLALAALPALAGGGDDADRARLWGAAELDRAGRIGRARAGAGRGAAGDRLRHRAAARREQLTGSPAYQSSTPNSLRPNGVRSAGGDSASRPRGSPGKARGFWKAGCLRSRQEATRCSRNSVSAAAGDIRTYCARRGLSEQLRLLPCGSAECQMMKSPALASTSIGGPISDGKRWCSCWSRMSSSGRPCAHSDTQRCTPGTH